MGKKKDKAKAESKAESRFEIRDSRGRRWVPAPFTLPTDRVPMGVVLGTWVADDERVEWVLEQHGGGQVTTGFKLFKK